jgi:diguanylate cyclase (GGDEF)-like protein/PAS domain S-box-containing protein
MGTLVSRAGSDHTVETAFLHAAEPPADAPEERSAREAALEALYYGFAAVAARRCGTELAFVSLVDAAGVSRHTYGNRPSSPAERQAERTVRRAILAAGDAVVAPSVDGSHFGFAAGLPLLNPAHHVTGTLCVFDTKPRTGGEQECGKLRELGDALGTVIDMTGNGASGFHEQVAVLGPALELLADPIAIFRRGEPGVMPSFVYINPAFTDLFGYTACQVANQEPKILTGPDTGSGPRNRILAAKGHGPINYGIIALYTSTGERRYVEMITHGLNPTLRIVSYRDVTRERAAQESLSHANSRLRSLISTNSDGIVTFDRDGTCVGVNAAEERLTGYARSLFLGVTYRAATRSGSYRGDEPFPETLQRGKPIAFTTAFRHSEGHLVTVECRAIPILVRGVTDGAYLFAKDVSEERRLSELVAKQAKRAAALCAVAALTERSTAEQNDAALLLALKSFDADFGYVGRIEGTNLVLTNTAGEGLYDVGDAIPIFGGPEIAEFRIDGWLGQISTPSYLDGRIYGAIGFLSREAKTYDDADRDFLRLASGLVSSGMQTIKQNRHLDYLAYFDELTRLPNRAHFARTLSRQIAETRPFALHFIDLDGFKALNDRAGHAVGDLALGEIGSRLQRLCGERDLPARLGGDEFVVVQMGATNREDAREFAQRISEAIGRPFELEGQTVTLGASVGVALFPTDGEAPDLLMRRADRALYRAKTMGKRRIVFAASGHFAMSPG